MAADPLTSTTVDDLLNDELSDFDDPFADDPATGARDDQSNAIRKRKAGDEENSEPGLGVEEEVKIVKKRKPIAKLDESRLLSKPGLPKLRELTRHSKPSRKLRLRGKGHEFSDAAQLLNFYQLWLDNLYPRAKFADGLSIIEKVGHTKRMQVMRKEWIDEGKPGYARDKKAQQDEVDAGGASVDLFGGNDQGSLERPVAPPEDSNALFLPDANAKPDSHEDMLPSDDELDALLAQSGDRDASKPGADHDSEGEDDLDALLAEHEGRGPPPNAAGPQTQQNRIDESHDVPSDDDLDALLAEQEARSTAQHIMATSKSPVKPKAVVPSTAPRNPVAKRQTIFDDSDDDEGEDDLDALLAEQETQRKQIQTSQQARTPTKPNSFHQAAATPVAAVDDEMEDGAVDGLLSSPILPSASARNGRDDEDGVQGGLEESQTKESEATNDAALMFSSSPLRNED